MVLISLSDLLATDHPPAYILHVQQRAARISTHHGINTSKTSVRSSSLTGGGVSANVLSVLVICKHHRGIILHNEALQRLPALTSRAKFGSGRNKSPLHPPIPNHLYRASHRDLTKQILIENGWSILFHASFGKTSGG